MEKNYDDIIRQAWNDRVLTDKKPAAIFFDLDMLDQKIKDLKKSYPVKTRHAFAIKSNPSLGLLKYLFKKGMDAEAASWGEVQLALTVKISPDRIYFDSPAKTIDELTQSLKLGIHVIVDNWQELERISDLKEKYKSKSRIGLRINPLIGAGKIKSTSVSTSESKFGISILEMSKIQRAFEKYTWLTGLHVHIGSQGYSLSQIIKGQKKVYDLISKLPKNQIEFFDIGGGLSVRYKKGDQQIKFQEHGRIAKKLFKNVSLVTEFGRSLVASCGVAYSKIEYIKNDSILVLHFGADLLLREIYNPKDWSHEIIAVKSMDLKSKSNQKMKLISDKNLQKKKNHHYQIVGPLCFSKDIIAKDIKLPTLRNGDGIIVKDVGAYTLSMWSRHCNRLALPMIGYRSHEKKMKFIYLKHQESIQDLIEFWS